MLVLSRKVGEKIVINDQITVEVVEIDGGKVRLGVTAPREIPVFRQELLKKSDTIYAYNNANGGAGQQSDR